MGYYYQRKESKRIFILITDNEAIGVFTNLKGLCEFASEKDSSFPSYWTLTRKKEDKIVVGKYVIQKMKIHE
jgi:hypothetical protein